MLHVWSFRGSLNKLNFTITNITEAVRRRERLYVKCVRAVVDAYYWPPAPCYLTWSLTEDLSV